MFVLNKRICLLAAGVFALAAGSSAAAASLELDMESAASIVSKGGKIHGGGFADGAPAAATIANGNRAFVSGGAKEGIEFPISVLPLKEGSISLHFKMTKKAKLDQGIALISAVGTPPYHNNFALGVAPMSSGYGRITFTLIGEKVPNTVKSIILNYPLELDEFYHLAISWKNLNSGAKDGVAEVYLNGRLIGSRYNEIINVPNPGGRLFVGSVDLEHTINKSAAGSVVIDDVRISDTAITADDLKPIADILKAVDPADGRILNRQPVKGGGKKQYTVFGIPDFPIEQGAIFCRFKLDELVPGKSVILFDTTGSPAWNDRVAMMLKMHENNILEPYFVLCGSPSKLYISKALGKKIPFDVTKEHTLLAKWKNVNSGTTNAEMELFLDGVSIGTLGGFNAVFNNPSDDLRIGGGDPPSGTFIRDNILTVEECRIWRGEVPPAVQDELLNANSAVEEFKGATIDLPRLKGTFKNDGRIDRAFWTNSADFGVLHDYRQKGITDVSTQVKAAYDENNLYLAWQAQYSEAEPFGKKHNLRDTALWNQDSLEMHFDAPAGRITYIISAYGDIYDHLNDNRNWNSEIQYSVHNAGSNLWTGTAVIPLKEIAADLNSIKGTIARNINANQSKSASWVLPFGTIGNWKCADKLIISEMSMPAMISASDNTMNFTVMAQDKAKHTVNVVMTITHDGKSKVIKARRDMGIEIATFPMTFNIANEGRNDYFITVTDENDRIIFSNKGFFDAKPPLSFTTKNEFYNNKLHVAVNAQKLAEPAVSGRGRILKNDLAVSDVTEFTVQDGLAKLVLDTSKLTEHAEYTAEITVVDKNGKESTRIEKFEFAPKPSGYPLGAGMKPYFGDYWFTPKFENGTVKVWNRVYSWKNSIFPASIISGGVEMLAATPYFEYRINGQTKRLSAARVTPAGGDEEKALFNVTAADDNLLVKAQVRVEYDGFIGYDMDVEPKAGRKIDKLAMVIPLQKDSALFKLQGLETTYSPQRNKVENYPPEGRKFAFDHKAGLGGYDRALFFCNESDEGWLPYDREDIEEIIPRGDQVIWRWNIVDGAELKKLPTQRMGFQVTPYKPLQKDNLQNLRFFQIWPGGVFRPTDTPYKIETLQKFKDLGTNILVLHMNWCKYTGSYEPDDRERFRNFIKEAHRLGMRVLVYRASITNEYEPSFLYYGDLWLNKPAGGFFDNPIQGKYKISSMGRCVNSPGYIDWYVGMAAKLIEEYDVDGYYYDFGVGTCNSALHGCGYVGKNTRSMSGEATGTIGINIGEVTAEDRARRLTRPVLKQRELWKRMYNMVKELKGEDGMIDAHTSAPERVFSYPFVDTMWHSESAAVHKDLKIDLDMYRTYFAKQSLGCRGELILYLRGDEDPVKKVRYILSMTLPHREVYRLQTNKWEHPDTDYRTRIILKFWKLFQNFRVDDAKWVPYWESASHAKISGGNENTVVSFWLHEDKALLVISNLSEKDCDLTIAMQGDLQKFTRAEDAENAQTAVQFSDGKLQLSIPRNDFRMIQLGL